ncbi:MAG TPA: tetratricopeptide repeat protein [Allosphingosinicella sp.]|nr:tetratricopeptide repeat protein [Allosphingosinicella sp.]
MQPSLDPATLFARAEQAFAAGRYDAARADLLAVRRIAAPHPAILHLLALTERRRGDAAAARSAFEAALQSASDDPAILGNYANFLADAGDTDAALAAYARALAAAPAHHDARYNRALLLQKLGRSDEALADLDIAVAARPADARVQSARGSVLRDLGRLADAAAAYDASLAAEPNRPIAAYGRARVAMERGEDEAPALYRRAAALRPGDPQVLLDLAEALEMQGDPDAVPTLAAAVAAAPAWAQGQKVLARMRWEAGEGRAFARGLDAALAAAPGDRALWLAYASALAEADLHAEAANAAARARAALGNDDPELMLIEALRASEAGEIARADRLFAAMPDLPGRSLVEARHRTRTGEFDRASVLAGRARAEAPWDVGAWALTGVLWRLNGDPRAAWLLEQPGFLAAQALPFDDAALAGTAERLRGLHLTRAHPIGQSLRGGTQTRGALFAREEPEIVRLRAAIEDAVRAYWDRLPPHDPAHPLLRHRGGRPRVAGSWSVRLTGGGFHVAHFHSAGALSSACYFVVPEPKGPMEGWLELGGAPAELGLSLAPLARIEPKPGRIALFPSFLFHGTRPFSQGERLTVAFDVVAE